MQESHISFRASPDLSQALSDEAERSGVSQSEIIRQAVRDRIRRAEPAEPAPFDPFGKIGAAARGDIDAQRALANQSVQLVMLGGDVVDPMIALSEGLVFARMAAAQGGIADQGLCISMLALMAEIGGDDACQDQLAEATARVALVADQGVEEAAAALPGLIDVMPAHTASLAKGYQGRLRNGETA